MVTLRMRFPRARRFRLPCAGSPVANAYQHLRFAAGAAHELSDEELRRAAHESGSFDFWSDPSEDLYTLRDGEPL